METKLDSIGRIYIFKPIRHLCQPAAIIRPNERAGIIYPKGTPLKHVRASLEVIMQDIDNEIQIQEEKVTEEEGKAEAFLGKLGVYALTKIKDYDKGIPVELIFKLKRIFPLSETEISKLLDLLEQKGRVVFINNRSKIKIVPLEGE